MKKLFLMLLAIALVGSFAFAEVTGVDAPSVSGSVTTTFGYNLAEEASGFQNDSSVDVVVPLAGGSDTGMGEGAVYAEITIEDIEISLSTDDEDVSYDASVSAKIVMGDMYIGLGNPTLDFNMVHVDKDIQTDADDDDMNVDFNADVAGNDGISFGYVTEAFSFEVGVASKKDAYLDTEAATGLIPEDDDTDWLDGNETDEIDDAAVNANVDNEYVFGLNASVAAGPLSLPIYFAYDANYTYGATTDTLMGIGAAPVVDLGVAVISLPMDFVMFNEDYGFELGVGIGTGFPGVGMLTLEAFFNTFDLTNTAVVSGSYAEASLTFDADLDEALGLAVGVNLENIVETYDGLGATALALTEDDLYWEVTVDASYDLGMAVPYIATGYDVDGVVPLNIGADFPLMIDNASVNVDYDCGDVADWENNKGIVSFGVTVEF